MNFSEIYQQFKDGMMNTGQLEYIAVVAGIASVWFSKKENIWVFPTGLVNTIFYIYLSFKGGLFGEASVNLYYTIMSIYGWVIWSKKDATAAPILHITSSTKKGWSQQLAFFLFIYVAIFFALRYLQKNFAPNAIPWADAFASAAAYTGMWLMARKKVESWYWWIITNAASIPLYFVKQYIFTSVYYFVLLLMAFWGLAEWKKRKKLTDHL